MAEQNIRAILLNACGTLGTAHLGFLWSLQTRTKLEHLEIISGTSIGSIVGMLYCLGMDVKEIYNAYKDKDFLDFMVISNPQTGLSDTDGVIAHLCEIMESLGHNPLITFGALRKTSTIKTLIVNATKIVRGGRMEPAHFSADTHPDMSVIDAIRLSICIPFVFNVQEYENEYYCDGVFMCELPFEYIARRYKISIDEMLAHSVEHFEYQNLLTNEPGNPRDGPPSIIDLTKALILYCIENLKTQRINHLYQRRAVITTPTKTGLMVPSLSLYTSKALIHRAWLCGIQATNIFLDAERKAALSLSL